MLLMVQEERMRREEIIFGRGEGRLRSGLANTLYVLGNWRQSPVWVDIDNSLCILGIFFSATSKDNIVVLMHSMHLMLIKGEKQGAIERVITSLSNE